MKDEEVRARLEEVAKRVRAERLNMHDDKPFVAAWSAMEALGFMYGEDALENVHLGYRLAHFESLLTRLTPIDVEAVREALTKTYDLRKETGSIADLFDRALGRVQVALALLTPQSQRAIRVARENIDRLDDG